MGIYNLPKRFHPDFIVPNKKPSCPVVIDWANPITRGTVGYYLLGGTNNAYDLAGHNGAYTSVVGATPRADAQRGQSYFFDGASDTIQCGTGTPDFNGKNQLTISVMLNHDALAGGRDGVLKLGPGNQANTDVFELAINSTDTIKFEPKFSSSNLPVITSTATLPLDEWVHLVITYDGANINIYQNGVLDAGSPVAETRSWTSLPTTLTVGDADARDWHGLISDFQLWDRGLSAAEVKSLFLNPYQQLKPATDVTYFTASGVGAQDISPTGIASAEAFGTAVLTTGAVDIAPTGIASAESFGTPAVTSTIDVSPTGIASEEAIGSPTISTGAVDISPTGIGSAEAFGTPVITQDAQVISPSSIASAESFGTPVVSTGAVSVTPTGIASSEAFGTPTVAVDAQVVSPNGIASVEAFGSPTLTTGAVSISPTGISSEESFGTVTVAIPGAKTIQIEGQDSLIINQNLGSTTLYFNGKDYFSI